VAVERYLREDGRLSDRGVAFIRLVWDLPGMMEEEDVHIVSDRYDHELRMEIGKQEAI
jgi:hypothetical protein